MDPSSESQEENFLLLHMQWISRKVKVEFGKLVTKLRQLRGSKQTSIGSRN